VSAQPTSTVPARVVSPAEAPAVIGAYFSALNGESFASFAELWTEDAQLRAVGSRPRDGRDEVLSYFGPLFDPWAEHLDQPTRCIVAEDVVVVEVAFSGRTHTGKPVAFDAVDVFDLRDGAIARLSTWYDLAWLRRQL
jgi:ketosteroid isomerase-like protein